MSKIESPKATELLAVDIGNKTTSFGLFSGDELLNIWTVSTQSYTTTDEAMLVMLGFFNRLANCPESFADTKTWLASIDSIVSCAVPGIAQTWITALQTITTRRPLVVGPGLKTGIQMKYDNPAEVGPDRIADLVAAKHAYGFPLIIIDCGMTVNCAVLDNEGAFVGGLIAPGITLSTQALFQAAARLPMVSISQPKTLIGKNNIESMRSGIVMGEVARIDGLIKMIWQELGYETKIVLAGEDAKMLEPMLEHESQIDEQLTLRGLKLLYTNNRK